MSCAFSSMDNHADKFSNVKINFLVWDNYLVKCLILFTHGGHNFPVILCRFVFPLVLEIVL